MSFTSGRFLFTLKSYLILNFNAVSVTHNLGLHLFSNSKVLIMIQEKWS